MTAAASRPAAPGRSGTWQPVQMGACSGRTFLVTGANTGIGLATATGLAERGGRVVLACRDLAKAAAARDAIASATGSEALDLLTLDLADLDAVRETVAEIERLDLPVDVLIANAGLAGQRGETAQGFELAFGVNHLGHFLLTTLLLPRLRTRTDARVVLVSSDSHYQVKAIDWDEVEGPTRSITGLGEYATSKFCNVLFGQELARRVPADELGVHVVHPGVIASDVWRRIPWPVRPIMTRFMRSTTQGAATSLFAATDPSLIGISGRYYADCAEKEPNRAATPELAGELWTRSEGWVR